MVSYNEEYNFSEIGRKGRIIVYPEKENTFEFLTEFEYEKGIYSKMGSSNNINNARGKLEGVIIALCITKGVASSKIFDVEFQNLFRKIMPSFFSGDDWLKDYCILPKPRLSEQGLMKVLIARR